MATKFKQLMREYATLRDAGQDDTEEARLLFIEMIKCAPSKYMDVAHKLAVDMGLVPEKPGGYSDDGEPLYQMEGICKRAGVSVAEIDERFKDRAHVGPFHRAH